MADRELVSLVGAVSQLFPTSEIAPQLAPDLVAERWRLACGALALGSFQLTRDGVVQASPELLELCGLAPGGPLDSVGELMERVVIEERPAVFNTLLAPVGVGSTIELTFHLVRVDGELREVQLRGVWVDLAPGLVLVAVVLEHPADERWRLADLAERYRALAEVSPDVIVVHQGGTIVYANPATLTQVRATDASQVVGMPILNFFTPESRQPFIDRVSSMAETGNVAAFSEERIVALDGTIVDIEATSILTTWEGRPAYQAVARVITARKAADRRLRDQAALIDAVSDAIVVCDGVHGDDMRIVTWSKGAERMYGWTEQEVKGRILRDVIGHGTRNVRPWWRQVLADGVGAREGVHRCKDGRTIAVHVSATILRDDDDTPVGLVTVTADISNRKAEETAHRQLEERYSAVVAALEEGIIVVDTDGTVQAVNAAALRILGPTTQRLMGLDLGNVPWSVIDEKGRSLSAYDWPALVTLRTGKAITNFVLGIIKPTGTIWISINCRPLSKAAGPGYPVVCSLSDITDAKAARERLTYAATHDTLTGLPNRSGITEHLNHLTIEGVTALAVLFVDLDRFKVINDSLGHTAGDRVLRATASRISEVVRNSDDIVGRLAGEEFVVLCPQMDDPSIAMDVASRLLACIKEPMLVPDGAGAEHTVSIGASIGVAYLANGESPEDVLIDADVAMYAAKENGRCQVQVFDETLRQQARERLEVREDLRTALERGELRVVYQSIVDPAGVVKGYEALIRWDHPTRGSVSPAMFIPIAEETGMVVPLGAWVLREAAQAAARWRHAGIDAYVSVNLSARQVADSDLVPMVSSVLADTGLPADALWLELTESSVMGDAKAATTILSGLKGLGVMLAIDDFGTGYSSLAYLEKFPVDALKIDRSFITPLGLEKVEPTLIAGVVSLAHSLNLSVIAEGVENATQARILADLRVDALQGHLYGRPGTAPFAATPCWVAQKL